MARLSLTPLLVRAEAAREQDLSCRPLYKGAPDDAPVVVLVEDDEPLTADRFEALGLDEDEAFEEALEELEGDADATWAKQAIPVRGAGPLAILVRQGEGASVEEVLVPAVMAEAEALLGGPVAVALPARGALLATSAAQKWQLVAAFATATKMQHERAGDEALWDGVLRVEGGKPVGVINLTTVSLDAAAARTAKEPEK